MKKVITYGTFDLLHQGHINLLRRAKELGDYLIVGVTTDNFDLERGKLNTFHTVMERIEAVRSTGYADDIIIEEYQGQKIDDIKHYDIDIFAIGSDWSGKFDYLTEYCEVVYLPRTQGISSTELREKQTSINIGIIGTGSIANRFVDESKYVNGNNISVVYNPLVHLAGEFANKHNIKYVAKDLSEFYSYCDAVYIASPHFTHYKYALDAIHNNKHVLCETPFVLSEYHAKELLEKAREKGLIIMLAHKTAYCPAFRHLISLLKSGAIGEIVDISASITTLTDESSSKLDSSKFGGSMNENACFPILPIFKLLGTDFRNINFYSKIKNDVDMFTKAVMLYDNAVATFKVGLGVKSEGNMVISGTEGYAYIPAPWWKTDYFELRFEDQNKNKKYFYPFMGEGLRYEIKAFISNIISSSYINSQMSDNELIKMSEIQEKYLQGKNLFIL